MNLREAKLALYISLVSRQDGTPVTPLKKYVERVFLNPPIPGNLTKTALVIATREVTPLFLGIDLAVYVSAATETQRSAELLDIILETIEENNLISAEYGPSSWTVSFSEESMAWVAVSQLEWGREDI